MSESRDQTQIEPVTVTTQRINVLSYVWPPFTVGLAVVSVILLPLNLLAIQRFHHDEALYATWGLTIVSGQDILLHDTPIDKPPLFLYTVAGAFKLLGHNETAARLPSLLATALTVLLTFFLGRRLFGTTVGVLAAWLVALSPFTLMFAPTAFTDPMLVAFSVASCLAAGHGRAGWAGVLLALAIATKQQGLFFAPLVLGLLLMASRGMANSQYFITEKSDLAQVETNKPKPALRLIVSILITLFPFVIWDLNRDQPSAYLELSLSNYGGLATDLASFGERWLGFAKLLEYATGSVVLNWTFIAGLPLVLIYDLWTGKTKEQKTNTSFFIPPILHPSSPPPFHSSTLPFFHPSILLTLFTLFFLALHAAFSFQIWDRYLLGLIPLLALLLARVLLLPWRLLHRACAARQQVRNSWPGLVYGLSLGVLLTVLLARPVQDAVNARYPLGSNSQDVYGIEQIVAYLQRNVGANNTLYHRWLGAHWRFYLWRYPYDLQFWDRPQSLATTVEPEYLIALPAWQSDTMLRLVLENKNYYLHEITRAHRPDGSPSIILYRIKKNR